MITARSPKFKKGLIDLIAYIKKTHNTKKMVILEIGSFVGDSTEIFAKNFKRVISVDPYKQNLLDKRLRKYNVKILESLFLTKIAKFNNVLKIKKESLDFAKEFTGMVDIVYIDGLHDYNNVKADIKAWLPKCIYFIAGHNYWPKRFNGVIRAVRETIGKPDKTFCDFSWIKEI